MTDLITRTGTVPAISHVATAIGLDPDQLDGLFPTSEHLVAAMAENAMLILHHTLIDLVARADADDPVEQIVAVADAYIEWGHRHPREFRIIGAMPASNFEGNERLMRYEISIHELMMKLLLRARSMSFIPEDQDLTAFISIAHTYSYGVVSKMLLGDLARWNPGMSDLDAARANMRALIFQFLRPDGDRKMRPS